MRRQRPVVFDDDDGDALTYEQAQYDWERDAEEIERLDSENRDPYPSDADLPDVPSEDDES